MKKLKLYYSFSVSGMHEMQPSIVAANLTPDATDEEIVAAIEEDARSVVLPKCERSLQYDYNDIECIAAVREALKR